MGIEAAQGKIRSWRSNPLKFVWDNFKVKLDAWQEDAIREFGNTSDAKLRLSLQAAVGPGKSMIMALMGWYFLSCFCERGEHPKGAAVSVTSDNLRDNLWPEFAKWQSRSEYLKEAFEWTKERIFAKDHPETWFLSARSFSKKANADEQGRTLSGLHAKFVLILLDESGEIPVSVLKAGEQAFATADCKFGRIVQAGNPTSLDGVLYAAAVTFRHLWKIIRITGDPEDPKRSPRIDLEWAKEQIKTYGRDNPWVMSQLLGLFPPASINVLLGPDEVEAAMNRQVHEGQYSFSQKRLGVDVARFGNDSTVLFPRQGLMAFPPTELKGARTNEIAARMAMVKSNWGSEMEFIDDTGGYGAGVVDAAIQAGLSPIPINFSSRPMDPRYYNKRSEMAFEAAEWVKRGGCLPNRPKLLREMTTPTYTFVNGKFRLEEKDQIKARLGFSPDEFDSLMLTFAFPDQPSLQNPESLLAVKLAGLGTVAHEWDPLSSEEGRRVRTVER